MNNKDLQTLLDINSSNSFQELKDRVASRLTLEQMKNVQTFEKAQNRLEELKNKKGIYTN